MKRYSADSLLRVDPSGRHFVQSGDQPWLWLGDTAWSLATDYTPAEAARYLAARAASGFTILHVSPLFDGGTSTERGISPNPNTDGVQPWANHDPLQPNEPFWRGFDALLETARRLGLYIALLPAWGSFVVDTKMITPANARTYARWIATRYKSQPNIFWVTGGDRRVSDAPEVWREIALGLIEGDGGAHLITFHPGLEHFNTSHDLHHEPWLAANMVQCWGHYDDVAGFVAEDYALKPPKPIIMAEGAYEEGPEYPSKPITPLAIRKQAWWSYLAGGSHTYGHNDMWRKNPTWEKSLQSEGARHITVVRRILDSLDWWNLVPAPELITAGQGEKFTRNLAARARDNSWVLVYLSSPAPVQLAAPAHLKPAWIDPTTGDSTPAVSTDGATFTPPAGWEDALLLLR